MGSDERWDNVNVLTNSDTDLEVKNSIYEECTTADPKFDIKSYIPNRSIDKYLKPVYVISSTVAIVVLVIIISVALSLKKSATENDSQSSSLLPYGLVVHNSEGFWIYDDESKKSTLLFRVNESVNSFDVASRKTIVFSEIDSSKIIGLSNEKSNSSTNYRNISNVFEEAKVKPQGVAIDFVTKNVYVVDGALELLIVFNARSQHYNILLSDLKRPREIVLDPSQGLMFISQFSDSILRGNMDGTSLTKIVPDAEIAALTLDRRAKRLYWIQDFNSIESSDYDGHDRKLVFADTVSIASLAVIDDRLFWLWPNYGRVNATLWSCRLKNDSCEEHVMHRHEAFHNARQLRASVDQSEDLPNLCRVNNGGCQHLCLTSREGSRSCACRLGWQLNPDRRTCRAITDFILYVVDNIVRGRVVDAAARTSLVDVFWPSAYSVESVKSKGNIDFDYDPNNDLFFFSDDVQIYQTRLRTRGGGGQTSFLQKEMYYTIEDLAYDWLTGNLYYSLRSKLHSRRHYLMMFNVNKGSEYKKVVATFVYDGIFGLQACPYALALHPSKGYLFFTAGEDTQRSIQRLTTNGTKLSQIYQVPYVHEHRLITLDYDKDKLYWIYHTDESATKIKYADFDGANEKLVIVDSMRNARTISVYHQWLYISNDSSIYRCHKETGHDLTRILPALGDDGQTGRRIVGVRLVNSAVQTAKPEENPCAVDNGGCERFCYAAPHKYCE